MEPLIELNHKERGKREGRKRTCVWRSGVPPYRGVREQASAGLWLRLGFVLGS